MEDPRGPGAPAECQRRRGRLGVVTLDQHECSDKSDVAGSHDPSDSPISADMEEGRGGGEEREEMRD